jgi:DNA replication protein
MGERQFPGFPAKVEVTPIPNLFFSQLLPGIDNIAELKLVLYVFWLLSRRRGYPKFVTRSELLADSSLMSGLEEGAKSKEEVLRDGLDRAVARGVILHMVYDRDGKPEDVYFVNSEHAKAVIRSIEQGKFPRLNFVPESGEPGGAPLSDVFTLYEQNIGMLTPIISEELQEAEKLYPAEWINGAFKEAVALNKRSWKYIARILERWAVEGRSDGKSRRDLKKDDRDKYARQIYRHMVKR